MRSVEVIVCMGSSCFSRGNNQTLTHIQQFIEKNQVNAEIKLSGCLCQNQCQNGPVIRVNGILYKEVDAGSALDIIQHELRKEEK